MIDLDKVWELINAINEISKAFEAKQKLKPGKRKKLSIKTKRMVLQRQLHRCNDCREYLRFQDFHHKDGNRSNNDISNIVALCPNCHAKKTRNIKQRKFKLSQTLRFLRRQLANY